MILIFHSVLFLIFLFLFRKNLTNFMATSTPIASSKGKGLPEMKFKSTPIRTEKRKTPTIEKRRSETNIEV